MPVTINASTSSGLVQSADNSGTIELQNNGTTRLTVNSSGATIPTASVTTLNSPSGVLATQNGMTGIAKAWVNFNGTGTVAINSSFNVSSITDNGTADYTINFTTALPNTNYALAGMAQDSSNTEGYSFVGIPNPATKTTSACQIRTTRLNVGNADSPSISVSVFSS